jgi:hypothetical protein
MLDATTATIVTVSIANANNNNNKCKQQHRDDEYCRKDVDRCNTCATNTNCDVFPTSTGAKGHTLDAMMTTIATVNPADSNNNSNKRKQQQKNEAVVTRTPRVTRVTIAGQAQIELLGRAGDTVFSDERTNTINDNKNTILLVLQK